MFELAKEPPVDAGEEGGVDEVVCIQYIFVGGYLSSFALGPRFPMDERGEIKPGVHDFPHK